MIDAEVPFLVAITYGKSFGLYGERIGHLCIPMPTARAASRAEQQMKLLARAETGAQPRFGATLVAMILENQSLKKTWEADLRYMAHDLTERRQALEAEMVAQNARGDWRYITKQRGMFL